jgi:hypothetical protein
MTMKRYTFRLLLLVAVTLIVSAAAAPCALAAPPINTARPTISGTPRDGQTLTASNGTWTNNPTAYQYQWQRCRADGAGCGAIAGATEKTYLLTNAEVAHTVRVRVLAVNADGATPARSDPTDRITASGAPVNTSRPAISGEASVGEELTADPGTWSNAPDSFAYQWQRCDIDVTSCFDVIGATGKTYGVRLADLGFRLRVEVRATNARGSGLAVSGLTAVVAPSTPITNARPALTIIAVRFVGARVYARFRVCDDSSSNLTILETDSRPGRASYNRRFSTLVPPRPCGAYTRSWVPAARFRGKGRYTITLRARDTSGRTSPPARRTFFR